MGNVVAGIHCFFVRSNHLSSSLEMREMYAGRKNIFTATTSIPIPEEKQLLILPSEQQ